VKQRAGTHPVLPALRAEQLLSCPVQPLPISLTTLLTLMLGEPSLRLLGHDGSLRRARPLRAFAVPTAPGTGAEIRRQARSGPPPPQTDPRRTSDESVVRRALQLLATKREECPGDTAAGFGGDRVGCFVSRKPTAGTRGASYQDDAGRPVRASVLQRLRNRRNRPTGNCGTRAAHPVAPVPAPSGTMDSVMLRMGSP
jgi:hypothetical protein